MFGIEIRQYQRGCDPVPRWVLFKTANLHRAFQPWLRDLGPVCGIEERVVKVPASKYAFNQERKVDLGPARLKIVDAPHGGLNVVPFDQEGEDA